MPQAPARLCTRCRRGTVSGDVCDVCGPRDTRTKRQRRPGASGRGYDAKWQKLRRRKLLEQPWCERCLAEGRYVPATIGHHKQEFADTYDPARLDSDNIEALCRDCHEREHGRAR